MSSEKRSFHIVWTPTEAMKLQAATKSYGSFRDFGPSFNRKRLVISIFFSSLSFLHVRSYLTFCCLEVSLLAALSSQLSLSHSFSLSLFTLYFYLSFPIYSSLSLSILFLFLFFIFFFTSMFSFFLRNPVNPSKQALFYRFIILVDLWFCLLLVPSYWLLFSF